MPTDNDASESGKLLTSVGDWISSLPSPEEVTGADADFREQPVDLEKWLYARAYMGLTRIRLSDTQFQFLSAMDDIDPNTNRWTEFVAEWGKGSGKDFICALAALRQVYLLLCLRNPYDYYGLAKGTGIQLVNVAYTKEQAKGVFLNQVKGLLRGSLWFAKHSWAITRTEITFHEHNIVFISGAADGDSIEGNNLFFGLMDEASAFKDTNTIKAMNVEEGSKVMHAADVIYNVLRSSTRSRFPTVGKVVIISYPRYKDDFTQMKRKENEASDSGYTSGPYATWEVNPRVTKEDFAIDYERNPEMAAAMYECNPPWSADGYVKWPERFITAAARGRNMGLESPIDLEGSYSLDFRGKPGRYHAIHVDLALNRDGCALALGYQGEPVERKRCPCNAFNLHDVFHCQRCGRPVEQWRSELLPTCIISLLKLFKPTGEKGEVDFSQVRDEILWIRDRGHKIWALSYDGWQSVDSRQIMSDILGKRKVRDRWGKNEREEDIVSMLSVDRNTEAHDTLKEMIYDERFFIYAPQDFDDIVIEEGEKRNQDTLWDKSQDPVAQAFREWRRLKLINGKKVDHPKGGSKDLVDALAGVAYHVSKMPILRDRSPTVRGWQENAHRARRSSIFSN